MKKLQLLILFAGLATNFVSLQSATAQASSVQFQEILDGYINSNEQVHGVLLHVESPGVGISWSGASGIDALSTGSRLSSNQPFRIASVTKTYVSVAILRLMEQKKLGLDDSVGQYIKPEHVAILQEDGYDLDAISIRHLLTHTSGLFDYAIANDNYVKEVVANPSRRWSRTDQLKAAVEYGDYQGRPGHQFHYSDTGYILLGEVIESVSGISLAEALRSLLKFKTLGLNDTWLESLEPAPEGVSDRVHQYFNNLDTHDWDPSMDLYGGGGLVSTTADLAKFYYHLFNGEIFSSPATLALMTSRGDLPMYAPESSPSEETLKARYRHGLEVKNLFGMTVYAHTGFWGVIGAYIPELDTAIAICVSNGSNGVPVVMKTVALVRDLKQNH